MALSTMQIKEAREREHVAEAEQLDKSMHRFAESALVYRSRGWRCQRCRSKKHEKGNMSQKRNSWIKACTDLQSLLLCIEVVDGAVNDADQRSTRKGTCRRSG